MNRKQEIKEKMKKSGGFCCISVDKDGNLSSPIFGTAYGGPTEAVTIYKDSIEDLLEEIDNMSGYLKQKYGSPYGNQTCEWN